MNLELLAHVGKVGSRTGLMLIEATRLQTSSRVQGGARRS